MIPTKLLMGVVVLTCAHTASANLSINYVPQNILPGFNSYEIVWNGPSDWTSAGLTINLSSGSMYQHALGGDSAPNPAFFVPFPELAFDTYVGIIDDSTAGITGGAGDVGGGPLSLDAPQVSVSWFNTDPNDTGPVRIGMLTVSEDALGDISYISQGVVTSGFFPSPPPYPDPEIYLTPTQPAALPGYTAYGIYWDGQSGYDWTGATLTMDLTQGTAYQDPFGGDGAPTSADITSHPTVEFDTYLGIIDDTSAVGPSGTFSLDAPNIFASWSNTNPNESTLTKIGNITLSNDAMGTWTITSGGLSYSGEIIPEPATLALLALTCPALLRRR